MEKNQWVLYGDIEADPWERFEVGTQDLAWYKRAILISGFIVLETLSQAAKVFTKLEALIPIDKLLNGKKNVHL
jgi:hypothetical protein